jgi:hypothetical protein
MLLLLPILLLLLGSLVLTVIQWRHPGFGPLWFVATIFAVLSWLSLGFLRFRLPTTFAPLLWQPATLFNSSPALLLDYSSWPYAFSIATLILVVILTAPARMQKRTNLLQLAGNLALGGIALLAIMAANPLTMILGWAAIDLIDFFILLRLADSPQLSNRVILSFGGRIAGILLVLWSVILGSRISGHSTDFTSIEPGVGLVLLIGVAFRLGVFPLHLSISGESRLRRGMGTILRFVPPASSLVVLSRLPADVVPGGLKIPLYALVLLAVIVSLIQIITVKNDLDSRPFWAVMLSSLAIGCVIRGFPASSTAWGVTLILMGGFLFINPYQGRLITALSFIGFASIAGIPFLPLAGGWQGLLSNAGVFGFAINFIVQCLFLGAVVHLLTIKTENIGTTERLTQLTMPFGLFVILVSYLLAGFWGWPGSRTQGIWAAGIASLVLVNGWLIFHKKILALLRKIKFVNKGSQIFSEIKPRLAGIFRIESYYNMGERGFLLAGKLVTLMTRILEGEGGILWAMVLLTLLFALVKQGIK